MVSLTDEINERKTKMKRAKTVVIEKTEVVDDPNGGLVALLGKQVFLICNYIYTGKLVGVNTTCVELEGPGIVYETGSWTAEKWKDEQKLPNKKFGVERAAIEAWGER